MERAQHLGWEERFLEYRLLGRTGMRVSKLCLGTMTFGNEADEAASRAIMERCFDAGINFFDTANVYNKGRTEEIVGRWVEEGRREAIVLATKAYFPVGDGPLQRGASRRHLVREAEASLRRLRTDWLDIFYIHHWDNDTALEESLGALDTLIQQGKVLYGAVSNFSAWQTMKTLAVADRLGIPRPVAIQPMYNLLKRTAEIEILPMAASEGLGVCPYSPIAAGLLTGKYAQGAGGRIKESSMYAERYKDEQNHAIAAAFADHARTHGHEPAALAVAWVASHPAVTSAIIGARSVEQLEQTLGASAISLNPAEHEAISALSPAPPEATDRESMSTTLRQLDAGSHTGQTAR